jgi:hypothetical protein
MPPSGCDNVAVKKIIACLNEASENLAGWKDLAFTSMDEIKPYFGDEGEEQEENADANVTVINDVDLEKNDQEER